MQRVLIPASLFLLVAIAATAPRRCSRCRPQQLRPPPSTRSSADPPENCQECHRPGAIAPMSFVTSKIRGPTPGRLPRLSSPERCAMVADPTVGHFKNAKLLSDGEIATMTAWAEKRAVERCERSNPRRRLGDGWKIGTPTSW